METVLGGSEAELLGRDAAACFRRDVFPSEDPGWDVSSEVRSATCCRDKGHVALRGK